MNSCAALIDVCKQYKKEEYSGNEESCVNKSLKCEKMRIGRQTVWQPPSERMEIASRGLDDGPVDLRKSVLTFLCSPQSLSHILRLSKDCTVFQRHRLAIGQCNEKSAICKWSSLFSGWKWLFPLWRVTKVINCYKNKKLQGERKTWTIVERANSYSKAQLQNFVEELLQLKFSP